MSAWERSCPTTSQPHLKSAFPSSGIIPSTISRDRFGSISPGRMLTPALQHWYRPAPLAYFPGYRIVQGIDSLDHSALSTRCALARPAVAAPRLAFGFIDETAQIHLTCWRCCDLADCCSCAAIRNDACDRISPQCIAGFVCVAGECLPSEP